MNISAEYIGLSAIPRILESKVVQPVKSGLINALMEGGKIFEDGCKEHCPVDTGTLRDSIDTQAVGENEVDVAPHTDYACIFDSQTNVITDKGKRCIGQVKVGDRVLTQTGEYKQVLAASRFSAELKPELITITAAYRKDRVHKLTTTTDHKILTYRDGRNQWIPTGELTLNDQLYTRIKQAHNKGNCAIPIRVCINCGKEYQRQGKQFCSPECRYEYWNAGHNPHVGMKRSVATRSRISARTTERLRERPETHPNRILSQRGFKTEQEREVEDWIKKSGKTYLEQYKVGKHYVDFYLPEEHAVVEADGAFWHQDQEKDIDRDREIKRAAPGISIMHVHFYDKRFSQAIMPNPSEDVYYVACNPGMHSYVDPTAFKLTRILKLEPWTYERGRGSNVHALYDLTVEDVHSFYANGILVSNSYVELGTYKMDPQPYMRFGYETKRTEAIDAIGKLLAGLIK